MAAYGEGDYVKIEFTEEATGESQWLWMRVERCDDANRLVFGKLDNEPEVFGKELKLGEELAVSFDNIRCNLYCQQGLLTRQNLAPSWNNIPFGHFGSSAGAIVLLAA